MTTTCRLCGGPATRMTSYDLTAFQPSWRANGVDPQVTIARCRQHGSWLTERVPSAETLGSQYTTSSHTEYYADENRSPLRRNRRLLRQMRPWVPVGRKIADYGGGDGSFAVLAAEAGYNSTLVELGEVEPDRLNAAGVRLLRTIPDEERGTYDAITLWDVFEHVWPHDEFLAPIHAALRPRGRLILEIPSPSNLTWPFLLMGSILPSPRREVALSNIVSFTHVQLMTPAELRATLPNYGFEPLVIFTASELAYSGVEYAQRLLKFRPLAQAVGAVFDHDLARRYLLGHNKTIVLAEKI